MKKRVTLVAVLAALLALTVVGCSFTISERNIVGTWDSMSVTIGNKSIKYVAEFKKGGTGEMWDEKTPDKKDSFTWKLSGDTVTIQFVDDGYEWVGYSKEAAKIDFETNIPDGNGGKIEIKFRQR